MKRLVEVAAQLSSEITPGKPDFTFAAFPAHGGLSFIKLSYVPNTNTYTNTAVLSMRAVRGASLEISGHGIGSKLRGLIGMVAIYSSTEGALEGELAIDDVFQVNYAESLASAERRFLPWLGRAIVQALIKWRSSL